MTFNDIFKSSFLENRDRCYSVTPYTEPEPEVPEEPDPTDPNDPSYDPDDNPDDNGNGDSNNDGTYTGDPSVMPDFWN